MESHVSIREFGRMVGLSHTAVGKAIDRGTIKKGVVKNGGEIIGVYPIIAAREWGKEFLPVEPDDRDDDYQDEDSLAVDAELASYAEGIPDDISKSEADRMVAVYKAKKYRSIYLSYNEGLVSKELIYDNLKDFSAIIVDHFTMLPERVIDSILTADGRNSALILLGNALAEQLTLLSHFGESGHISQ
jgi:hypothetical protein